MSPRKIWPTGWRAIVLLIVGSMMGATLITPAVADIGSTLNHLWGAPNHIKDRVKAYGDGRWVRSSGLILYSLGHGEWEPYTSSDNLTISRTSGSADVRKATTGSGLLALHPAVPVAQYGRKLRLKGVEYCYDATDPGVTLATFWLGIATHSTGPGTATFVVQDLTDRDDEACRLYNLATPVTLGTDDALSLFIEANWSTADTTLQVARTTLILEPTTSTATAPTSVTSASASAKSGGSSTRTP